jgi:hypothetical protein
LYSPFTAWFPGGATVLQALTFVLSHGSQNPSIIRGGSTHQPDEPEINLSLFNELTISDPKL